MKALLSLVALVVLAGCAAGPRAQSVRPAGGEVTKGPGYEYQLDVVYTEGATPFLHLVPVSEP